MSAEPPGRVLIASNRGPVSFSLGNDGKLTSRRGGGGVVAVSYTHLTLPTTERV